ncbi:MAG: HAMP domain-containing sensor histidine kinase [Spirosomataceae bacterium]
MFSISGITFTMRNFSVLITTLVILVCLNNSFAESLPNSSIDSLEKWLRVNIKQDTIRINNLIALENLYQKYLPEKIGSLSDEIISLSKKNKFDSGVYKGVNFLAYSYILNGKIKEATSILLTQVNQHQFPFDQIRTLMLLGFVQLQAGLSPTKALEYFKQAKTILEGISPNSPSYYTVKFALTQNIGMAYSANYNPTIALKFDLEAWQILNSKFKPNEENTIFQTSKILLSIGIDYLDLKNYYKSILYLERGLRLAETQKIKIALPNYYIKLSEAYLKSKKFTKAKDMIMKLTMVMNVTQMEIAQKTLYYDSYAQIEAGLGNYKQAYSYKLQYQAWQDTMKNIAQNERISELNARFESKEKETKIKNLELNNQLIQSRSHLYLVGILGLLVALLSSLLVVWQIRKAKYKVEEANKQRDQLFSIVAHDLRSPVANLQHISSTFSFVLQKNDPTQAQLLVKNIEAGAVNLYKLVDNLLNWALSQQGHFVIRPSRCILEDEIQEIIQSLESNAAIKNIKLQFEFIHKTEVSIDRTSFQTIVRNLVDNAIKFSNQNGTVKINVSIEVTKINVRVSDSGIGIPLAYQQILFSEDIKKSRIGTFGEKGTGIGLFVCRELAIINAWQLYLESSSNTGSTFCLTMKL